MHYDVIANKYKDPFKVFINVLVKHDNSSYEASVVGV